MRNSELIEIDFIAALNKEITNYELQTAINVNRKITPEFRDAVISPNVRIHILNIIKEALNNVRKHAEAENLFLTCDIEENNLTVIISDDGKGFENKHMKDKARQSFGLKIMHERVSEMGGILDIDSKPGKGSRIRLRVPLERGMDISEIKVMIVDDHKLFLEGLQYLLEAYKVNIVGKQETEEKPLQRQGF